MIGYFAKTVLISMLILVITWGWSLAFPSASMSLEHEVGEVSMAIDDPILTRELMAKGLGASFLPDQYIPSLFDVDYTSRISTASGITGLRLALVSSHLTPLFLLATVGLLIGLWFRERIREGLTYASPTRAFLAKTLVMLSVLVLVLFAMSPLQLPPVTLWILSLGFTFGASIYAANMPIKL